MANIGPTAQTLYRRARRESPICPCCDSIENNTHIIQCTGQKSMESFASAIECLQQWMKVNIPGDMCLAITELLISVHEGREIIEENFPHSVSQAVLNQMSMGRHMLQWGILSKQWRCIVQEYLQGTRKSTFKVLATLCNKIWAVTEKLWKNRCDEEHNNENSLINDKRSQKVDEDIDKIYEGLPSLRSLPMVDRAFF